MKHLILLLVMTPLVGHSQILFDWANSIGNTNLDQINAMSVDNNGNSYSAGAFQGTIDFDPSASVYNMTANGTSDIYILKLDNQGNFVWAIQMGGSSADAAIDIECDNDGNILLTGSFRGPADFDPTIGTFTLSSAGGDDPFIAKYTSNGTLIWAKSISAPSTSEAGIAVTVDSIGNVYSSGFYWGTADLDPSTNSFNVTSLGNRDIYIQKLDSSGNFLWGSSIGGSALDYVESIELDNLNNLIIGGYFNNSCDFDGSTNNSFLTSFGNDDAFLCKYNSLGNYVWSKQFGGGSSDNCRSLSIDSDNNIYFIGTYSGTADFDPNTGTFNLTTAIATSFMAKVDSSGTFLWANSMNIDYIEYITVDNYSIYTTGNFTGTVDFDPGTGTLNLTSQAGSDIFISKLDSSGMLNWAKSMPSNTGSVGDVIKVGPNNSIYVVGEYADTCDFDIGSNVFNLISNGNKDIFIAKYNEETLSVNQINNPNAVINIFPNPVEKLLNINTQIIINKVVISDISGRIIKSFSSNTKKINVSDLKNGIYILQLYSKDNISTQKFIKQ